VADFLGVSNLLSADCASGDANGVSLEIGARTLRATQGARDIRGSVKAMIRPERVGIEAHGGDGENRLPGMVEHAVFLGSFRELHVRLVGGDLVKAIMPNDGSPVAYEQGSPVTVHFPAEALRVLPPTRAELPSNGATAAP
ncbi:MAG: spermidine/putrescine transport system ATP-binding protein, partial [Gaiellales bacterium]|nr:spermidine/putrescine transport system ATP-binding protein [Gaiellales bacterium]